MVLCEEPTLSLETTVTASPLCCKTQRETFIEVTAGFNNKFTEPVLLDITGSNYRCRKCLLPPPNIDGSLHTFSLIPKMSNCSKLKLSPNRFNLYFNHFFLNIDNVGFFT